MQERWQFGSVELDRASFSLRRDGSEVKLDRKPMELLLLLAERGGRVVSHDEALRHVWGEGVFVDGESALYTAVKKIRRALGEADLVQTVSGRGYRLRMEDQARAEAGKAAEMAGGGMGRIAILPLVNLSSDPEQAYFSDGLTEELISTMAKLLRGKLLVIARTSVMRYKDVTLRADEIGRALGVDYLVEGSVRREHQRVRIAVKLLRAADGACLWSEVFERSLQAVFPLQTEIAAATASAVCTSVVPELDAARSEVEPEVHDLYLRARFLWAQRTRPAVHAAIRLFEEVLQRDDRFAPAYAGLSCCFAILPITSLASAAECFGQARSYAEQAIALDASLHEAHIALGLHSFWFERKWGEATQRFRTAEMLNPGDSAAPMFLAHVHSVLSEHAEALRIIRAAQRMDPLSPIVGTHVGHFLYNAQQYEGALGPLDRVLQMYPKFWIAHLMRGKVLASLGQVEEGLRAFAEAHKTGMGNTEALAFRIYTLRQSAREGEADLLWRQMERMHAEAGVPAMHRALARLGTGDVREAERLVDEAFEEHDVRLVFVGVERRWRALGESRYAELVRRVGLSS